MAEAAGPRHDRSERPDLVSVAIPTRGRGAWCEEAVRSALAQEGVRLEVVVAVDGPDAETEARLAAIRDARLRVVVGPAGGRSAARNRAWREGCGRWVAFLDDDDVLLPGSLATRAAALAAHPGAVLAHGVAVAGDERARPRRTARAASAAPAARAYDGVRAQLRGRSPLPSTVMMDRAALAATNGFDESMPTGEDWELFLRAGRLGAFVAIDAPVVVYRRHAGQVRWDPAQQEAALPALLARAFDAPDAPPSTARLRRRLEARLLAYVARNYRRLGKADDAHRCLRAAVGMDPRLLLHPRRLRAWLAALLARRSAGR